MHMAFMVLMHEGPGDYLTGAPDAEITTIQALLSGRPNVDQPDCGGPNRDPLRRPLDMKELRGVHLWRLSNLVANINRHLAGQVR